MANKSFTRQRQHHVSATASECQRNGHLFRKTFTVGERLCTRCGKKFYCPTCTATIPPGAHIAYCVPHDPHERAISPVERSVQV